MLDIKAVVWLEEYLRDNWEKTLLIVSHDREFLNQIITDCIHFSSKKLTAYTGSYDDYDRVRTENLKNQQRAIENQSAYKAHVQKFIDRFRYKAARAALVQSRIKMLSKLEIIPAIIEDPTISFTFPQPFPIKGPLISLKNVAFGYDENNILFPNLTFDIDMESRIAIVGANGQGKTTFLNILSGSLKPRDGYAIINPRLKFAKFSQHHIDQMNLSMTPLQYLESLYPGKTANEYRSFLGRYGISGDIVFQKNKTLSGGQKSRVVFATMALSQPHILLLDEPTNHLDIDTVDVLAKALNDFTGGVVLISHDERLLTLVCNELWEVKK
jgi:ATP-binding cassette subfamily F protein 3